MNNFYVYMYLDPGNIPFYIGKGKDQRYRISTHIHKRGSNPFLINKINKVGVDKVQIKFPHKDLTEEQSFYLEEYYIAGYGRRDLNLGPLCNLTNGGEGSTCEKTLTTFKGRTLSNEIREKISKALIGRIFSKSSKQKMSIARQKQVAPMLGHNHTEETKRKISDANKGNQHSLGYKHTEETKRKISEAHKGNQYGLGHTVSEEHRQKISARHKGSKHSEEHNRKTSATSKGRKPSDETKRKISESMKRVRLQKNLADKCA